MLMVLLDAPDDSDFVRLIQAGVITKFKGISCFVEKNEVVSGKLLDDLIAQWVSVVVNLVG